MSASAGCRRILIVDPATGEPFPALVFCPAAEPEGPTRLGPFSIDAALDAPAASGVFPLAVISHGHGGSHLVYRTLAAHLARHGYVVVSPEHPRNNRNDNSLGGTAENLAARPRRLRATIDWAFSNAELGPRLTPGVAAVIGHSLGGYTALVLAGGTPTAFPHESPDGRARRIEVQPDNRVKALVLLAPATAWFLEPESLRAVRTPILMLTAEHDPHTPAGHAEIVKRGVAEGTRVEHRVVPGAGHFSFLSPFPPAMTNPGFAPSQDPPGFDRARFHEELNAEVLDFLRRTLPPPVFSLESR